MLGINLAQRPSPLNAEVTSSERIEASLCGINGIFAYGPNAKSVDVSELKRTRDHMVTRGPDGHGAWVSDDRRIGLAHRRLSIIDLSANASQPMITNNSRYIITFNGEIYNYAILKERLEKKGYVFVTKSDTEVLLYLYADEGVEMVHSLRGMYAFAIWDRVEESLFLARDPYGIKPLYYCDNGKEIRFASQVKALVAGGAISTSLDPAGQVGFLLWGSVPEPFTSYAEIRSLPAGCHMLANARGLGRIIKYFSVAEVYSHAESLSTNSEVPELASDALLDSVKHHLIADVPVGVFLSAGIDSGALLGLMRDAGQDNITAVTLRFGEFEGSADDEAPLAALVAKQYGARHTIKTVEEAEFIADLPQILAAMDQPSVDGINTWFVSKAAREAGLKVAISGVGGDELFGGYPAFHDVPNWARTVAPLAKIPFVGAMARRIALQIGIEKLGFNPKIAGMLELGGSYAGAYLLRRGIFMPWELDQLLDFDVVQTGLARLPALAPARTALDPSPISHHGVVAALESSIYMRNQLLRDADWASMAHSLEVRTPLVDAKLLETLAPALVGGNLRFGKSALAAAPSRRLPEEILKRRKTGFRTPIEQWLRAMLAARDRTPPRIVSGQHCPWARRWAYFVAGTPG